MRGKNQSLVRQGEELLRDRIELFARIAAGKITSSGPADQERIAGEDAVACIETHAVGRVAGRGKNLQGDLPDGNFSAVVDVHVDMRRGRFAMHDDFGAGQILELKASGAVVSVCVRVDDRFQPEMVVGDKREIAVNFLPYGVDQSRSTGFFAADEIGLALAAVEFAKDHWQHS